MKIMEKIIREILLDHLLKNGIGTKCQHGFINGRSCLTNLLEALEDWTTYYDRGEPYDIIYLDFKKASDSVPHQRLLYKLERLGINGNIYNWIEAFLTEREQCVSVNGVKSKWVKVKSGVPQGSVLGPILFTIFVNDLPDSVESICKIFADDTKIYSRAAKEENTLHRDLTRLEAWSKTWKVEFNAEKCKVMHCGYGNTQTTEYWIKIWSLLVKKKT